MPPNTLLTVGAIAAHLQVPFHRVRYVVERYGIRAAGRAGNTRVFSAEAVERIQSIIAAINQRKEGEHAS